MKREEEEEATNVQDHLRSESLDQALLVRFADGNDSSSAKRTKLDGGET